MKGKTKESNRSYIGKEGGEEAEDNPFSREIVSGDLLWIKLHKSSWWPAQVVDENTVSGINKPSNRSAGEVLVRLYGSYKYLYVDPIRCHLEFENILKVNNGNCGEILKKALEQDLTRIKSGRSKVRRSKSKAGIVRIGASQEKMSKQNIINKIQDIESPTCTSGFLGLHPAVSNRGTRKLKAVLDAKISTSVSPRISGANTSPTKVKNANFFSENPGKESRKRKQVEVQKKLEPNSPQSRRVPSSRQLFSVNTEAKSGIEKQDRVHKKLKMAHPSSVRMSPRLLSAATKPQTLVRDGNLLSEKAERTKTKNQKEDGVQKKLEKLKTDHPGSVRRSPRRLSPATKLQTLVRDGNLLSEKGEGAKTKNQKEDRVQKKLEPSPTSKLKPVPSRLQTREKNGNSLSEKNHKPINPNAQTQKKVGIQENPEPNGAESATTSVGKPPELSARKTKVMLSLGLIAPSGSPFHRNGYISPSSVL